jgi:PBP1b-binding outer membrane lipoprotein LpoB
LKKLVAALAMALAGCSPAPANNAANNTAMPVEGGPQQAQAPGEARG